MANGVSDEPSLAENMRMRGLYPVSPTASHFPFGLSATDAAALTRSLADVVRPGDSDHSRTDELGEIPAACSFKFPTVRWRGSLGDGDVGQAPSRGAADEAGLARKKCWVTFRSSSTVATTAAAPAVKANLRACDKQSKPFAEEVVVPMTLVRWRPGSSALGFVGDRGTGDLTKGEFEGVSRRVGWIEEFMAMVRPVTSVFDYATCGECRLVVGRRRM